MPRATLPIRRTYSWTSRTASLSHVSRPPTLASAPGQPEIPAIQLLDAVADARRLLEFEIGRGRLHLLLQSGDVRFELAVRAELSRLVGGRADRHVIALVHAGQHLVDALHDRCR